MSSGQGDSNRALPAEFLQTDSFVNSRQGKRGLSSENVLRIEESKSTGFAHDVHQWEDWGREDSTLLDTSLDNPLHTFVIVENG